jgi:hypothetical protein
VEVSKKHTCPVLLLCSDVMISTVVPPCVCCVFVWGQHVLMYNATIMLHTMGALLAPLPTLRLERCCDSQDVLETQQIATNW